MTRIAIAALSGGQDSTTSAAWARQTFDAVHAVTFDYGQRHAKEIEAATKVAQMLNLASHEVIVLGDEILKSTSPLVDKAGEVGHYASPAEMPGGVEPTFIPARNLLFLAVLLNRAAALNAKHVVLGVCQADYGGYPDCRQEFITAAAQAMSQALFGTSHGLQIHTPLMDLTKRQSVELAQSLPGAMDALAYSLTSYDGDYPPNPFNHASLLRARGFEEAGVGDPLILRAKGEGLLPEDYPDSGYVPDSAYAQGLDHTLPDGQRLTFKAPGAAAEQPASDEEAQAAAGEAVVSDEAEVVQETSKKRKK